MATAGLEILSDRRQSRRCLYGNGQIVISDYFHVSRHVDIVIGQGAERAHRDNVGGCNYAVGSYAVRVEKSESVFTAQFLCEMCREDIGLFVEA